MKVRFRDISKNGITKTSVLINKKSCEEYDEIHLNYVFGIFGASHNKEKNVLHFLEESNINYKFCTFIDIQNSEDLYFRFRATLRYYIELFNYYNTYDNIHDFYKNNQDDVEMIRNKVVRMLGV